MGATFSDRPSVAGPRYVFSPAVTLASLIPEGVRYKGRNTPSRPPSATRPKNLPRASACPTIIISAVATGPKPFKPSGSAPAPASFPMAKTCWAGRSSRVRWPHRGHPARRRLHGKEPALAEDDRYPRWLQAFNKTGYVFNQPNAVLCGGPLVICEGPGDAMRCYEAGYIRAVAAFGASLSNDQSAGPSTDPSRLARRFT